MAISDVINSSGLTAICPHCQSRYNFENGKFTTPIKRQQGCQCPRNWLCTICNEPIDNWFDFLDYERNGTHVVCGQAEMYGFFRIGSDGYPESCIVPAKVTRCPCCSSPVKAEFDEWTGDDNEPSWDTVKVDCMRPGCYEEYQDSEFWRMPYVYWLPVEEAARQWMQRRWKYEKGLEGWNEQTISKKGS